MQTYNEKRALERYLKTMRCPRCDGKGRRAGIRCALCAGTGNSPRFEKIMRACSR